MVGSVRTRRSFATLSASRERGRSGPLWVVRAGPSADGSGDALPVDEPAVAYAIGTSVGPAVVRNRLRRRLRVLMNELDHADCLPAGHYLVGAQPAAAPLAFGELRRHLEDAVETASQGAPGGSRP